MLVQAAQVGVSLCQTETSVAAPFTSQHGSIFCMLQGMRCLAGITIVAVNVKGMISASGDDTAGAVSGHA